MGGAANKIILGCQVFGLLSEQGVAKNSFRGARGLSMTERVSVAVRESTGAATKMASKGENLGLKQEEDHLRQSTCVDNV